MTNLRLDDVLYDPLPLYHSAGGMVGAGQTLLRGITVVVRRKFSATNFWKDCVQYNCTVIKTTGMLSVFLKRVFFHFRRLSILGKSVDIWWRCMRNQMRGWNIRLGRCLGMDLGRRFGRNLRKGLGSRRFLSFMGPQKEIRI